MISSKDTASCGETVRYCYLFSYLKGEVSLRVLTSRAYSAVTDILNTTCVKSA